MSKSGKMVIGSLILIIIALQVLFPAKKQQKPKRIRTGNPLVQNLEREISGEGAGAKVTGVPNPPGRARPQPQQAQQPQQADPMLRELNLAGFDFDMLREKYGRDDPFAPFIDFREGGGGEFVDLPDLEPLPPMVLESHSRMNLTAIAFKNGVGAAVINGEILRIGDALLGFKVVSITQDKVELANELKDKVVLRLKHDISGSFDVKSNIISNIKDDPDGGGRSSLIPRPPSFPLPPAPQSGFSESLKGKKESPKTSMKIPRDPAGDALKEVDQILSRPENKP